MALEVNKDNYDMEVLHCSTPVMVDFWGPQCKPCLALMPSIEELEEEYNGKLKVAKVDASQNRMLCAQLRVMSLPTFILYKDGKENKRLTGQEINIDDIKAVVEALLS
jgi:thioredoxin 1